MCKNKITVFKLKGRQLTLRVLSSSNSLSHKLQNGRILGTTSMPICTSGAAHTARSRAKGGARGGRLGVAVLGARAGAASSSRRAAACVARAPVSRARPHLHPRPPCASAARNQATARPTAARSLTRTRTPAALASCATLRTPAPAGTPRASRRPPPSRS